MKESFPHLSDTLPYSIVAKHFNLYYHDYKAVQSWRDFVTHLLTHIESIDQFNSIVNDSLQTLTSTQYEIYKRDVINEQNLGKLYLRNRSSLSSLTIAINTCQKFTKIQGDTYE